MVKLKKLLEEKSYEITNLNRKLESRGELIAMLIFLFFASIFILPNMFENVNESEFCLKKMETYFPEYDLYKASYCSTTGIVACAGDIKGTFEGY